MAQQRANDLSELSVDIELFPMPKPPSENGLDQLASLMMNGRQAQESEPQFDVRKFYANIISFDEDELMPNTELLGIQGSQNRMGELMKRIRQKEFKKRALGKCQFNLSPGAAIGLSFFNTIIQARKPIAAKVNAVNNKQLRGTQKFVCRETGRALYR